MSDIYFTADYHLGHAKIILYCDRKPFYKKDIDNHPDTTIFKTERIAKDCMNKMNSTIINNHNEIVKDGDIVYHVGDFCFRDNGTARDYEKQLNGTIVHIRGNHDKNNGVKTLIDKAIMDIGNYTVLVQHKPPAMPLEIPEWVDFVICGHVHNHWKVMFMDSKPIINVGIDQWDFKPVSVESILKLYKKLMRNGNGKFE
jgi:calcineurin-like phosphoesterase family protein